MKTLNQIKGRKGLKGLKGLLLVALLALLALLSTAPPAQADPQQFIPVAVTNIPSYLPNGAAVTNIGAVYKVPQNAQLVYQYTAQIIGTSAPSSTVTFGHNFTVGDGYWTSATTLSHALSIGTNYYSPVLYPGSNVVVGQFTVNWTNLTGEANGRLDSLTVSGATNFTLLSLSIGAKQIQPY